MSITAALAGNPNCGKTTMFNGLTGSSQYVGNWPGVTVEKKEGKLKGNKDVIITDLPGIYSLSPYTLEEVVTRDYLMNEKPDVIINLIDASNIERNLYLTTQLLETGIPVIIALNMIDIVKKRGETIDTAKLSKELGCKVVETSAVKGEGIKEVAEQAVALAKSKVHTLPICRFDEKLEKTLEQINEAASAFIPKEQSRWYTVKLFERDEKAVAGLKISSKASEAVEQIIASCEDLMDDDCESIISNERYNYVNKIVNNCVKKKKVLMTTSDKIDQVVTNRWLALPIFAAIMFLVYYVSIQTVGDWTIGLIEEFFEWAGGASAEAIESAGGAEWISSLVEDGILGGVGAVLAFVPQLMILFFFLSLLEDCGYMARVAFIMDRIFRKFGLSGKSFIPMLISSGCGVPGIMASRTIENEKDRKMTIIVTTFIPCGAKLPIIALIAGALFREAAWVAPAAYFLGVAMVIISGIILKKTKLFTGEPAPFVMELPQYHVPGAKGVLIHMWERAKAFIIKAGTIIFLACAVIWFLSSFGFEGGSFGFVDVEDSILAGLGGIIAPLFAPLGFGDWRAAVATISGLVAKENVVGTFGVLFGLGEVDEESVSLMTNIAGIFTTVSAMSFMIFNLLCAPCFAAIGAIKREMGGWKWTFIAIGYQTLLAYIMAFIVYQLGSVIFLGTSIGIGTILAVLLIGLALWLLFRSYNPKKESELEAESANANA